MINLPHNYLQYRLQWIEILGIRYKPGGVTRKHMQVLLLVGIVSCVCETFQLKTYSVATKDSIARMCVCACMCSTQI